MPRKKQYPLETISVQPLIISPRYNCEDEVYYLDTEYSPVIIKGCINIITTYTTNSYGIHNTSILYCIEERESSKRFNDIEERRLFASKEELLKSLDKDL